MIEIKTGFSQRKNEEEAVSEVFEKIKQERMNLIVMFADGGYNQEKINRAWRERVPEETAFLGSASLKITVPFFKIGKNLSSEGFKEGLVAMSLSSDKIEARVKLMKNIKENWEKESSQALREAASELNLDLKNVDPSRYFGLFLCDTASAREDDILENLYAISNLAFVGGGSMGKMGFKEWLIKGEAPPGYIHTKEGVFRDAAVLALVRCEIPFKIDLTTNFFPTQTKFVVTKAQGMLLQELNGKPALQEYIKALGVSKWTLGLERFPNLSFFADHPLGLMVGNRAYIRHIASRKGNSLQMASRIKEGQTLYLMRKTDIVKTTEEAMRRLKEELGEIKGMILFHCGLRSLEAEKLRISEELFRVMNIAPLIGCNTFREYYGFLAMEYSLAILAIGE